MTATNRKRSRALFDDDSLEFMPLSKRINNLHINTSVTTNVSVTSSSSEQWGPGPPQPLQYSPELSPSENPYYYNNKILFDLHIERMTRHGHQQF